MGDFLLGVSVFYVAGSSSINSTSGCVAGFGGYLAFVGFLQLLFLFIGFLVTGFLWWGDFFLNFSAGLSSQW